MCLGCFLQGPVRAKRLARKPCGRDRAPVQVGKRGGAASSNFPSSVAVNFVKFRQETSSFVKDCQGFP
jgi:hypothetical protein